MNMTLTWFYQAHANTGPERLSNNFQAYGGDT